MYQVDKIQYLQIGVQGENEATNIDIDVTTWLDQFPGASFGILFKPYNSPNPAVPVVTEFSSDEKRLTWVVTASVTNTVGVGYTEIRALDGAVIKKSRIIPTSVENSVSGGAVVNPPEAYEDWYNSVLQTASDAEAFAAGTRSGDPITDPGDVAYENNAKYYMGLAEDAQEAAEDAQEAAEDAQAAAEDAQSAAEDARDAAQAAAGDFQGLTATAIGLPAGDDPTVNVTHTAGGFYTIGFGIPKGDQGNTGPQGPEGPAGVGLSSGGTKGQALLKKSNTDYDTEWQSVVPYADQLYSEDAQQEAGTFLIRTSGGEASIADGDAWLMKLVGRRTHTGYTAESIDMTVNGSTITATLDRDTFVAYVATSGTTTLTYTSSWSANPATYGITVSGTPVNGDSIVVAYVKEVRGTITQSDPLKLVSTGWNLYDHTAGYARVIDYSEQYAFMIDGTYTSLAYSATVDGAQSAITVVDGQFTIPGDGYVHVTGGNDEDTAIWMTWSDWTSASDYGDWQAYSETEVDLTDVMTNFPYGLMQADTVSDEIDLNALTAISRIERQAYSAENRAAAVASGRAYEFDENYIYVERETPVTYSVDIDGGYIASDHGLEMITGSTVPVYVETVYGQNLKDKLRRDVVTISAQTLTAGQKEQVKNNLGINEIYIYDGTAPEYSYDTTTYLIKYKILRIGNICLFTIESGRTKAISTDTYIITVPNGYKPMAYVEMVDTVMLKRWGIDSNGRIKTTSSIESNKILRMSIAYITNDNYPSA